MSEAKDYAMSATARIADQTVTRGNGGEVGGGRHLDRC
jgi:hypothetical protein